MTRIRESTLTCGVCGTIGEYASLLSASDFSGLGPDLDWRPPLGSSAYMHLWLQQCPDCGYVAEDITQTPEDMGVYRSEPYRSALHRADFAEPARRFLAHAQVHIQASNPYPAGAAYDYLYAAWVCDDKGLAMAAALSRTWAAEWLLKCKPFADDEAGCVTGAILVDVLRRSGQFEAAAAECAELLERPTIPDDLAPVLHFQARLIAERNPAAHRQSDCPPLAS